MNEHDKQVSGVEATANAEPSKERRRFVKGAVLAMPAIVTLRNGSAQSASSSKCAENAGGIENASVNCLASLGIN